MIRTIKSLATSIILILVALPLFAQVLLTDEEYGHILQRIEDDQKIIDENNKRWQKLKKSEPKIDYKVKDGKLVIQNIEIPVHEAKPLKYEVEFEVLLTEEEPKWFPFKFFLCGMLETNYQGDDDENLRSYHVRPLCFGLL